MNEEIDIELIDTLIERPHAFCVGEHHHLNLYPMTLGKSMLAARRIKALEINETDLRRTPVTEALRLAVQRRREVIDLITLHTLRTKEDIFDAERTQERAALLDQELTPEDLAQLLLVCLTDTDTDRLMHHLGIDQERRQMERAVKEAQKGSTSVTFGGKSLYGALLDAALERYGWAYDYLLWGISFANLKLLMADRVQSVYLTKEQRKGLHLVNDRTRINADDKQNAALIANLLKEQ